MEWDNDKIITFLQYYANERVIWDPYDRNHKVKFKVRDAWKRISELMGTPIEELKMKKKSLMATFRPLLKKKISSIRSGAEGDEVFQPIWFAYDIMESFLGQLYDVEALEDPLHTEEEPQQTESTPPQSPPLWLQPQCEQKIDVGSTNKTIVPKKRPKLTNFNVTLDEAQNKINESFDTLNQVLKAKTATEEDECDLYTKLLAKKLRKYPEGTRDTIMYKIDGLLLENPYPCQSYNDTKQT